MNLLDKLILAFGVGYSFLLMWLIERGMHWKLQLLLLLVPVAAMVAYGVAANRAGFNAMSWGLLSLPVFMVVLLNLMGLASWKYSGRELRIKLRSFKHHGDPDTNRLDTICSLILVAALFGWPWLVAALLTAIF